MKLNIFKYNVDLKDYDIIYRRDMSSIAIVCQVMKEYSLLYNVSNVLIREEKLKGNSISIVSNLENILLLLYKTKALQANYLLVKNELNKQYLKLVMEENQRNEVEKWVLKNKLLNCYPKIEVRK